MFNPFEKPIEEITEDDLKKLLENEVAEGYLVEYKSTLFIRPIILSFAYPLWLVSYGDCVILE